MQFVPALVFVLAILVMGCDAADPLVDSVEFQTQNVYFEGNIPPDVSVAVSYGAYDRNGRSMDYIIDLMPESSALGDVKARVFLPTTIDSLRSACIFSLSYSKPDLTFYLTFDSDGLLSGDSTFDIPYPKNADVSEPIHRVHFRDVVRVPESATVRSVSQDGSESDESRREQLRESRKEVKTYQTNHVYFGGSALNFQSYSSGYRVYDRAGRRHSYGITFVCGKTRCVDREVSVGLLMPRTLDSLSALPGPMPGYDERSYDHRFTLSFDAQGELLGDASFIVPYPADADVDPSFHTLHFERLGQRSDGELPMVCRQDGSIG